MYTVLERAKKSNSTENTNFFLLCLARFRLLACDLRRLLLACEQSTLNTNNAHLSQHYTSLFCLLIVKFTTKTNKPQTEETNILQYHLLDLQAVMKLLHPLFRATKLGLKRSSPVTNSIGKLFFASSARTNSTSSLLRILPEVSEALASNKPVVALESTILAHGLPHPENITLANELSSIIRSKGAIPATIAVKDGVCRVGLTPEELNDLALSGLEGRAAKCSTRDLPLILAKQRIQTQTTNTTTNNVNINTDKACQWGATTVASTMYLAHMAGIQTFVTGGTGGVHRGAESTMDVSADLLELARTPVLVVSAGVKSILDIHRTLEMLETNGVPAVAFGRGVKDFPAFFSPSSGVVAPAVVESAEEAAQAFLSSLELGLPNGMLVAVPNQDPAGEAVEDAIQETIEEANKLGIAGRDVTPYILKNVAAKTKGESLKSNTALVKGNAAVGADIAVAIANANAKKKSIFQSTQLPVEPELQSASVSIKTSIQTTPTCTQERHDSSQIDCKSRVAVMGGSVIDLVARPVDGQDLLLATSNPGVCHESDGGVGRNIAEVLGRLGSQPVLFSAVGNDSRGNALIKRMKEDYGISTSRQTVNVVNDFNTATYLAVLQSDGDLHTAIADMAVLEKIPIPQEEVSIALLFD